MASSLPTARPGLVAVPGRRTLGPQTVERTDIGTVALAPGQVVDVVIACHSPDRPVGRAVASVLEGNPQAAVTVVCHNLAAHQIAGALGREHRGRVRYLEHADSVPSPAGPFNAGMLAARTPWVSIMGSDDQLMAGAVASWLALARTTGAQMVVPRLWRAGRTVPTPPVRLSRLVASAALPTGPRRWPLGHQVAVRAAHLARGAARADLVADRLAYRSAPLGLLRVEVLRRAGIRLVEGARVGEDVAMVTRLAAEVPTAYDALGPAYLIGEDASDRVTYVVRPMDEQLGFLAGLVSADWFTALDLPARRAVAVKMTRIHVFGAVHYRDREETWTPGERESLRRHCLEVEAGAPGYAAVLSRAERRLLDACLDTGSSAAELIAASRARRRHGSPATLVPRDLRRCLAAEAPVRLMAASVLTRVVPSLAARMTRRRP